MVSPGHMPFVSGAPCRSGLVLRSDNSGNWRLTESGSGARAECGVCCLLSLLAALALLPRCARARGPERRHRPHARAARRRARRSVLVRAPLEAMQDIVFPTFGPGYLDVPRAAPQLRDAAQLWLVDNLELYEGERRVPLAIVAVRASIPSDRSFAEYDSALAHFSAAPLPAGLDLPWQQALLDVQLEAPIESRELAVLAATRARERLGMRVVNAVRFFGASGVERVFQIEGDAGVVALDPRWHQSLLQVPRAGLRAHPRRRRSSAVPAVPRRAVSAAAARARLDRHGVHGGALGHADRVGVWRWRRRALVPAARRDADRAVDLLYGVENVVCPNPRTRWPIAFGFGLVHGFGFSFALQNTLQFAGDHVLTSLLAFNVGIELGQLLVLVLLVPALNLLFRYVDARVGGIVLAVIVGHTAWHWLLRALRGAAQLRSFSRLGRGGWYSWIKLPQVSARMAIVDGAHLGRRGS